MFLSIITPTFNSEKNILKNIESLNLQEKIFEQIIVDNQSNDKTIEIINKMANYPFRIISEKDNGIYDAMNKGTEISKGDFILYLNSDDWLEPSTLKQVRELITKNPHYDIYYGNTKYYNNNKLIFGTKSNLKKLTFTNSISHQATYFKKDIFKSYSYDLSYKVAADYDLNLTLKKKKFKYFYIDKDLSNNSIGGYSSNLEISFNDFLKIQFKYNGIVLGLLFTFIEYRLNFFKLIFFKLFKKR